MAPSRLGLLHHTDDTVVIDKPAGMAVHKSAMSHQGPFAVRVLSDQLGCKVYPVHRLDRPTSGCLLFALNPGRATALQAAMSDPAAEKRYLAMVRGRWTHGTETLVVERPLKDDRKIPRDAVTEFDCLGSCSEPRSSLVLCRPRTGRFHQIRRHANGVGHPVLGDSNHGDTRTNRLWRDEHGLPRLALHCLSIDLPGTLRVEAPLPADLLPIWRGLPWWPEVAGRLGVVTETDL